MEKAVFTICVYGDFAKKDIRIKLFEANGGTAQFAFQNTLKSAGYDAELFTVNNTDVPFLMGKDDDK
jgi:hypothetical protein